MTAGQEINESNRDTLVEYQIKDTPLSLIPCDDLLEATLRFMYGDDRKYKKDSDGKTVVGMHKDTKRYSGSKKERAQQAAKTYYHKGNNLEKQKLRMRKRRRLEKDSVELAAQAKDRDHAEKTGQDFKDVVAARHKKKADALQAKRAAALKIARDWKQYK